MKAMKEPAQLAFQPFGQIPTYEEGDLDLFESGSIILHLAETHPGLLPDDANARARAITWLFAALNVERGKARSAFKRAFAAQAERFVGSN